MNQKKARLLRRALAKARADGLKIKKRDLYRSYNALTAKEKELMRGHDGARMELR